MAYHHKNTPFSIFSSKFPNNWVYKMKRKIFKKIKKVLTRKRALKINLVTKEKLGSPYLINWSLTDSASLHSLSRSSDFNESRQNLIFKNFVKIEIFWSKFFKMEYQNQESSQQIPFGHHYLHTIYGPMRPFYPTETEINHSNRNSLYSNGSSEESVGSSGTQMSPSSEDVFTWPMNPNSSSGEIII